LNRTLAHPSPRFLASQELFLGYRRLPGRERAANRKKGLEKVEHIDMKAATYLAVAMATLTSIPLVAQQLDTSESANESAKTIYAPAAGRFGDEAASHAWEMSSITGELEGKLDSKTAKPGDRVVLKTDQKVQTSDGTVIPRGSRLVGHVTGVQAYDKEHGFAQIGIAFDRAELKNGQRLAIYTLIRGVSLRASLLSANPSMNSDDMLGAPMGDGGRMGGGRAGDGTLGGPGGTVSGAGGMAGGTPGRTSDTTAPVSDQSEAGLESAENAAVQTAGHGGLNPGSGAHAAAAARAIPHPTGIPGVWLAGNSSASGLLLASSNDIQFESGTQMQLGIVAQ
jgi:hypothetical protein